MTDTNVHEEKTAIGEGFTLVEAIRKASEQLGLDPSQVYHKLDLNHFKNAEGRNIGVDTVKVLVWPRDGAEMAASTEALAWMKELLGHMEFDATVESGIQGRQIRLRVRCEKAAHIVGRAGVTIDAIRLLLTAHLGELHPGWSFDVDVEDTRPSRSEDSDGDRPRDRDRRPEDRERGRDSDQRGRHDRDDRRSDRPDSGGERRERPERRRPEGTTEEGGEGRVDEKLLQKIARKVAKRVVETGEPELIRKDLNSYARRVVHMTISEYPELRTESVGEGSYKQIRVLRVSAPASDEDTEDTAG